MTREQFERLMLRARACVELGIAPTVVEFSGSESEARAMVLSLNVHRRHLTTQQKRDALREDIKRDPTRSDRQIAAAVGVSPSTVGATRTALEGNGQLSKLDSSTGADGKVRPRNPYHEKRYAAIDAELLRDPFRSNQARCRHALLRQRAHVINDHVERSGELAAAVVALGHGAKV